MDSKTTASPGILYLIPSSLGDTDIYRVIPSGVIEIIHSLDHFVVENERTARRFLIKTGYKKPVSSVAFHLLNEHTDIQSIPVIIEACRNKSVGLLSEAGMPAVADPGSSLIKEAHKENFKIIPLSGPSSILMALMASGLNGQNFSFHGYLPVKDPARTRQIKLLERQSRQTHQAQIFIETPYRNNQIIESVLKSCFPDTLLTIAANLTMENEWIKTKTIHDWKTNPIPDLKRQPAVFIIQS